MWPHDWFALGWLLAALGSVVFWILVAAIVADFINRRHGHGGRGKS